MTDQYTQQDPTTQYPQPEFPEQDQRDQHPGLESEMQPQPDYGYETYKGFGRLQGKKAIITGGDSGIGRAVPSLKAPARERPCPARPARLVEAATSPGSFQMDWYPLRLTTPTQPLVFGGRAIAERLGRGGLPDGRIGETWEVSDVEGMAGELTNGPLAGRSLHQLVQDCPEGLMGRGWRGEFFPVLTKFIDAKGMLPVHLHADDATAQRLEGQANGKTEA